MWVAMHLRHENYKVVLIMKFLLHQNIISKYFNPLLRLNVNYSGLY